MLYVKSVCVFLCLFARFVFGLSVSVRHNFNHVKTLSPNGGTSPGNNNHFSPPIRYIIGGPAH